jgi:Site-specific recombinase XerC
LTAGLTVKTKEIKRMASIIKRKTKYSVVYYYDDERGEKRQKWETYCSYQEAKKRKAEIESSQSKGTFIPPSEITVKDFLEDFVRIYGREKWALSTFESNIALIRNYITPIIGDVPIQHMTTKAIDEYYQTLKKTKPVIGGHGRNPRSEYVTPGVINAVHKVLRCAFEQAMKWELISKNPFPLVNKPKIKYQKREIWTSDMIKLALDKCQDPKLYLAMNLAFACSLRSGEIAGLTWDKVHISDEDIVIDNAHVIIEQELSRASKSAIEALDEKDIIYIFPSIFPNTSTNLILKTPKTESSVRKVWLPKTVALILQEWKSQQSEIKEFLGNDYQDFNLVVALQNGRPCEQRVIEKEFCNLRETLNLPKVVFHSLRHSSTTYKLKLNNGDLKATQGDTGHSQIDMITQVYAHILDEDRKMNALKFENAFYSARMDRVKTCNELRNVNPSEQENANPDVQNIINVLNTSPELANVLSTLLQQGAISKN